MSEQAWAAEEFGSALLGNVRRTRRLVDLAEGLAGKQGGTVRATFGDGAMAEGAYRFLECKHFETQEIVQACGRAAVERSLGESFAFVPVDATALTVSDPAGKREVGRIGTRQFKARGLEVMTAMLVDPAGVAVGLLAQRYWSRSEQSKPQRRKRKLEEKETRYWLDVIDDCRKLFARPGAPKPWCQLDRGADFREMALFAAKTQECWVTFRSAWNRTVVAPQKGPLRTVMAGQPVLGHMRVDVPARDKPRRRARKAKLELRAQHLCVRLTDRWAKTHEDVWLYMVHARETGTVPPGEQPIEWMLWTNRPVRCAADAALVVFGYCQRWRIEEFHKTWKSVCCIERNQLHSLPTISRWAIMNAAVSVRIERLKRLSRTEPQRPALMEFSQAEIDAAVVLAKPKGVGLGASPDLGTVMAWVCAIGGQKPRPSLRHPPGSVVIGRGLEKVAILAESLPDMLRLLRSG